MNSVAPDPVSTPGHQRKPRVRTAANTATKPFAQQIAAFYPYPQVSGGIPAAAAPARRSRTEAMQASAGLMSRRGNRDS